MLSFIVYPILGVAIFTGVKSWIWRIILLVITAISFFFSPFNIVIGVILIIGIAIKNTLSELKGDSIWN
jgi:hypothetical protein